MEEIKFEKMTDDSLTEIFVLKAEYFDLPDSEKNRGLDLFQSFIDDQRKKLGIEKKAEELLRVLNQILESCKPITYEEFNTLLYEKEEGLLEKIEKEDNRIGLRYLDYDDKSKGFCASTLTILATMTDMLLGKRLAIECDDKETKIIDRFTWYEQPKTEEGGGK